MRKQRILDSAFSNVAIVAACTAVLAAACSSSETANDETEMNSAGAGGVASGGNGGQSSSSGGNANSAGQGSAGMAGSTQAMAGNMQGGSAGTGGMAGNAQNQPDAGVVTMMGGQAGSTVSDPAWLFNDGFETGKTGEKPGNGWRVENANGDTRIDEQHIFSGSHALKVTTTAGGSRTAYLHRNGAPIFPLPNNTMWGRLMMWIDKVPQGGVHSNMVEVDGNLPGGGSAIYRIGGWAGAVTGQYMPNDCYWGANKKLPEGRWACVEWQFDGSAVPGSPGQTRDEMRMWVDGQSFVEVQKQGQGCAHGASIPWKAPQFSAMRFGWTHYQEATAVSLWIDDLVIASKRVGCPVKP